MDPLPLFIGQFVWFLVAWTAIGRLIVGPRLRGSDTDQVSPSGWRRSFPDPRDRPARPKS